MLLKILRRFAPQDDIMEFPWMIAWSPHRGLQGDLRMTVAGSHQNAIKNSRPTLTKVATIFYVTNS